MFEERKSTRCCLSSSGAKLLRYEMYFQHWISMVVDVLESLKFSDERRTSDLIRVAEFAETGGYVHSCHHLTMLVHLSQGCSTHAALMGSGLTTGMEHNWYQVEEHRVKRGLSCERQMDFVGQTDAGSETKVDLEAGAQARHHEVGDCLVQVRRHIVQEQVPQQSAGLDQPAKPEMEDGYRFEQLHVYSTVLEPISRDASDAHMETQSAQRAH